VLAEAIADNLLLCELRLTLTVATAAIANAAIPYKAFLFMILII
jgi:hypothetical protein